VYVVSEPWSSNSECEFSDTHMLRFGLSKLSAVDGGKLAVIHQVLWRQAIQHFVHESGQLIYDMLSQWQPTESCSYAMLLCLINCHVVFVIQDFCFNPSASPFHPTTCMSPSSSRLTAMHSETQAAMAAQLPYFQPSWSQTQLPQSSWSNVYQQESPLTFQQYDSSAYYAAEQVNARNTGFEQQGSVSYPVDWYLDNTGNPQALQTLLSFQVLYLSFVVNILSPQCGKKMNN